MAKSNFFVSRPETWDSAKQIVLEIIRQAGGTLNGSTRLYKAFYFAHLRFYERTGSFLTDHPIVRMPNGPGFDAASAILGELEDEGLIGRNRRPLSAGYFEDAYQLKVELPELAPRDAREAISDAVDFVINRTAAELSAYTHQHSHAWQRAKDGEEISYILDMLTDAEIEQREGIARVVRQLCAGT